jgi:RNase P subunit RPR2
MDIRTFHGNLSSDDLAKAIVSFFQRGNLFASSHNNPENSQIIVQLATKNQPTFGGQTALGITLQDVEDGVMVQIGKQAFLGVAASLGVTALTAFRNPLNLINRLDDLAQDIEYLQLSDQVWDVIEDYAKAKGASFDLSERLRRYICNYCNTPNPLGESNCIACGAPLGNIQPKTCLKCGFVVNSNENYCTNCGAIIPK